MQQKTFTGYYRVLPIFTPKVKVFLPSKIQPSHLAPVAVPPAWMTGVAGADYPLLANGRGAETSALDVEALRVNLTREELLFPAVASSIDDFML